MSEPEITNPVKTKNPKRVEQGKRLAAISREAKERKRQQQEEFFESAETEQSEGNKIFFGIGLIGAAFLIYEMVHKIFFKSKATGEVDETERSEDTEVTEAYTEPEDPNEVRAPTEPRKTRSSRSYQPYTMD